MCYGGEFNHEEDLMKASQGNKHHAHQEVHTDKQGNTKEPSDRLTSPK